MKVALNAAVYDTLPPPIADHVRKWAQARRTRHISVERSHRFFIAEYASLYGVLCGLFDPKTANAAGGWSGLTGLRPTAERPLPFGCAVIETGFFLGKPFLTIYHNGAFHLTPIPSGRTIRQLTSPAT
jgi:hypothetical protein